MSTVAERPRARRASARPAPAATIRHGKCSLHLSIGGTRYRLCPLTPPPGFKVVWSLRKQAEDHSATYQVAVEKGQPAGCTCPDHEINGAVCKHIGALKALGLIPGRKARPAVARRAHGRRLAEASAEAPAPAGPFAVGFQSAVAAEVRRISGQVEPEAEGCLCCGDPFDPAVSRDPPLLRPLRGGRGCLVSTGPVYPSLHIDRAGVIRPELIPLAAFLCAQEYDDYARSIILDHAASGAPLRDLTIPVPSADGWRVLEPHDLAAAEEALARGGPAPAVEVEVEVPASISGGAPVTAEPATLVELVDHEAMAYRAWHTPEGDFLADQLERVAQLIRWTGATTPQEHIDRMEVWEDEIRDRAFERGYQSAQDDALERRTFGPLGRFPSVDRVMGGA